MPLLGALGGNLTSLLLRAKLIVNLSSVVSQPKKVCGQRSLGRVWILRRALCSLWLASGCINDRKRISGLEKAGEIELVDVEVLVPSNNGI